mmetsp:Transcript_9472/g.18423  ORF Transcript_9472/g.18423 Transcript_9472/m.18423 type:complete len:96 (-) Transcript_9472:585-872(-)
MHLLVWILVHRSIWIQHKWKRMGRFVLTQSRHMRWLKIKGCRKKKIEKRVGGLPRAYDFRTIAYLRSRLDSSFRDDDEAILICDQLHLPWGISCR